MLAYQPVGPNVARVARLMAAYPETQFSTIVDDADVVRALSAVMSAQERALEVFLDVDVGMRRTGIPPGPAAVALYRLIGQLPGIVPAGLHIYDGHIRTSRSRGARR